MKVSEEMEAISLMKLVKMGVKVLVTFRNIALMILPRLLRFHLSSNIDSFLLIDVCRKFERKLQRFVCGKSQFTHEESEMKLIFVAELGHKV